MTETFTDWTAYDAWLVKNYEQFSVYKLDETDGTITAEYRSRNGSADDKK